MGDRGLAAARVRAATERDVCPGRAGPGCGAGAERVAPDLAFADARDPNPGSGSRKIIAGWIGLGVAAVNFAQLPFCYTNEQDGWLNGRRCLALSASIGSVGLGLGVSLLVLGCPAACPPGLVAGAAWPLPRALEPAVGADQAGATLSYGSSF